MKNIYSKYIHYIVLILIIGIVLNFCISNELVKREFIYIRTFHSEANKDFPILRTELNSIIKNKFNIVLSEGDIILIGFYFKSLSDLRSKKIHFFWRIKHPYQEAILSYEIKKIIKHSIQKILTERNIFWTDFTFIQDN